MSDPALPLVWLNGALLPERDATIPATSPAALMGLGLFETVRVRFGAPLWADAHHARLLQGLVHLGRANEPVPDLAQASEALFLALGLEHGVARWTWFGLSASTASWLVSARPLPGDLAARRAGTAGFAVTVERGLAHLKSTSWLPVQQAQARVSGHGPAEAILMDSRGEVLEGARSNLVVLRDGEVHVPPRDTRRLPGIALQLARAAWERAGTRVVERTLWANDLLNSDAVFLSSSVVGLARLASLDGQTLGHGALPPVSGWPAELQPI
jgi:branched-chain amino acid aminotransferase